MKRDEGYDQTTDKFGGITQAIIDFSNNATCEQLDTYYRQKSNLEVVNQHRKELAHSRILAWLLDPAEFHGLGTYTLKKFLEACVLCQMETLQNFFRGMPSDVVDCILVDQTKISAVEVFSEYSIEGGRIDVFVKVSLLCANRVEKRLWVLIENKVDSSEQKSQTRRYKNWVESENANYDYTLFVYLTPEPSISLAFFEEPECECKEFLQINYQYLLENLIEPAKNRTKSEQARDLLEDYVRALSVPASSISSSTNTGDEIMAISEKERKLLTAFFDRYEPLIKAALYAISVDPERKEEEIAETKGDLDVVSDYTGDTKCNRDYSRYSILNNGAVVKKSVKKADLGYEVVKLLLETGLTDVVFEELRNDKSSRIQLLKKEEEISESERKYNKYGVGIRPAVVYNKSQYYVSRNWGDCNLPRFQEFLKNAKLSNHIELVKESV